MSFPQSAKDLEELLEPQPRERPTDVLDVAVGSTVYERHHRVEEPVVGPGGLRYRLVFSRLYFAVEPKVAVDYKTETHDRFLWDAKIEFCERRGWRLVVVEDEWDVAPFMDGAVGGVGVGGPVAPPRERPAKALRARRTDASSG